jgi:PAS domain S-box-containing protein
MVSCSLIDINTRKIAEKAAEENLAQYKLVTENSPTGIIIVRDEKIAYTNPAFAEFSGYSPQELVDTDPLLLIHKDDRLEFNRFFRERGTPKSLSDMTEYRFITKTGKIRLAALFFTPITQKGTPGVLINLVDLSEREQLKERIENDNERRREMLSTVAGELRSLLKPVMGYLNMLTDNPKAHGVTDETRAILDRVAKSVDRERQIINQMLELSVLDAGRIPLTYSVFAVTNLLNAVIDAGGYRLKAEITTDIPPGLTFEADETKISFVIDAMLSNAVNYSTFPRKIRIMYRSTPEDSMHRLSIQDNGVGITSAQLDEIFEPLRVPESGTTRRKSGRIGLSLSIAKKYIQMHGGYISVESIVNLGSTFSIHIPKHKPADEMNHAT